MFLPAMRAGHSSSDFFADTPWLNVPAHRLGNISEANPTPRGYLLGGSSKPSKLAALAAARKKKQEEARANTSSSQGEDQAPDKAVAILDRLKAKSEATPKETSSGSSVLSENTNVKEKVQKQSQPRAYPIRNKNSPSLVCEEPVNKPEEPEPEHEPESEQQAKRIKLEDVKGNPSTFASTIFGSGGQLRNGAPLFAFPLPYTSFPEYAKAKPFAGPSPDDVVLNAQAKGAIRA